MNEAQNHGFGDCRRMRKGFEHCTIVSIFIRDNYQFALAHHFRSRFDCSGLEYILMFIIDSSSFSLFSVFDLSCFSLNENETTSGQFIETTPSFICTDLVRIFAYLHRYVRSNWVDEREYREWRVQKLSVKENSKAGKGNIINQLKENEVREWKQNIVREEWTRKNFLS